MAIKGQRSDWETKRGRERESGDEDDFMFCQECGWFCVCVAVVVVVLAGCCLKKDRAELGQIRKGERDIYIERVARKEDNA